MNEVAENKVKKNQFWLIATFNKIDFSKLIQIFFFYQKSAKGTLKDGQHRIVDREIKVLN